MRIKLLVVGKTDSESLAQLIRIYENRIHRYLPFTIETLPDLKKVRNRSVSEQKTREGALILKAVSDSDYIVLLDENGKTFTSQGFAAYIQKQLNSGRKTVVFVIGGPYGFSEEVYARAQERIALSKMTFSHQMVRLFFTEQLYRAFSILNNEPYHHQ